MRITKFGHACVRLEHEGRVLVLDPGGFTDRAAVEGADAVLVTHEHPDHLDLDHLRAADAPVWTVAGVVAQVRDGDAALAERVTTVTDGDAFEAAGFAVRGVGEQHAVIHPELARPDNTGYLVSAGGTTVFHPGDSFTEPGVPVDVLLLPISAPWLKLSEVVDYARAVAAPTSLAIHDALYTDIGTGLYQRQLDAFLEPLGCRYAYLQPGEDLAG